MAGTSAFSEHQVKIDYLSLACRLVTSVKSMRRELRQIDPVIVIMRKADIAFQSHDNAVVIRQARKIALLQFCLLYTSQWMMSAKTEPVQNC